MHISECPPVDLQSQPDLNEDYMKGIWSIWSKSYWPHCVSYNHPITIRTSAIKNYFVQKSSQTTIAGFSVFLIKLFRFVVLLCHHEISILSWMLSCMCVGNKFCVFLLRWLFLYYKIKVNWWYSAILLI